MNENIIENQTLLDVDAINILFKPIKEVNITDSRIRDAFKLFVSNVEIDGAISVGDIIFSAGDILRKRNLDENAGNMVFCYDRKTDNKKLLKNTVNGLFRLLNISNGISLDIEAVGGNIKSAYFKNYLIIPEAKTNKFKKIAEREGIQLRKAGNLLSVNAVILTRGNEILEKYDKSTLVSSDEGISVTMGSEHFDAFTKGYNSLLSYDLCNCVSDNNVICFGLSSDIASVLASAVGYFAAALKTKSSLNKIKFFLDSGVITASPRPDVSDGDYFYFLKLRNEKNGLPDFTHFCQLKYYLTELKKRGVIKNVLPYKENINSVLSRLGTDSLVYDSITDINEKCFGVVVSVNRGESVNGIKLGYFRSV